MTVFREPACDPLWKLNMARTADPEARRRRSAAVTSISTKLQAILWVVAAVATVHYTDFVHVCLADPRVHRCAAVCPIRAIFPACVAMPANFWRRIYFNVSVAAFAAASTLILYLAVYLPYFRGIDTDWMEYCPNIIYSATAFGAISGLT